LFLTSGTSRAKSSRDSDILSKPFIIWYMVMRPELKHSSSEPRNLSFFFSIIANRAFLTISSRKKCLSCISGLPFLGIPLLESPLLEPTWLGDLGEFGDLEWTEICNGETDNGSALSEADRTSSQCTFDVVSVLVKNIKLGLSLKFKTKVSKPAKTLGPH